MLARYKGYVVVASGWILGCEFRWICCWNWGDRSESPFIASEPNIVPIPMNSTVGGKFSQLSRTLLVSINGWLFFSWAVDHCGDVNWWLSLYFLLVCTEPVGAVLNLSWFVVDGVFLYFRLFYVCSSYILRIFYVWILDPTELMLVATPKSKK